MNYGGPTMTADVGKLGSGAASQPKLPRRKRTAVLVVHGIGSQRALETVRGVMEASWLLDALDSKEVKPRRVWTHPEYGGIDLDLSVMTTSDLSVNTPAGPKDRSIDYHELYWAHLMSETRAVAVLLWLFELVRKGPRMRTGMNGLWWGASIFLCMLLASVVLLTLHAILQFLGQAPLISDTDASLVFGAVGGDQMQLLNHPYHEPEAILIAPFFVLCMIATYVTISSVVSKAFWVAIPAAIVMIATYSVYVRIDGSSIRHFTELFLPIVIALGAAYVIMGKWGVRVTIISYLCAGFFFGLCLHARHMLYPAECWFNLPAVVSPYTCIPYPWDFAAFADIWNRSWIFWALHERYSALIAVWVIVVYLAFYALFLQPYLGDAARYFRNSPGNVAVRREIRQQAVDTLDALHTSGRYDRIIVVAHSLGTVIAYDMLRAYFSRICSDLPDPATLGTDVNDIDSLIIATDKATSQKAELRKKARNVIRAIAATPQPAPGSDGKRTSTWLVTDFVTLGSALTHAHYLMCLGDTSEAMAADFDRRVREREFPTCPPARLDSDGLLLFKNANMTTSEFSHGAVFGLTRWTNLYFPLYQLFWGDAIGGELAPLFGSHIEDIPVSTYQPSRNAFFTHTAYWSLRWPSCRGAPHIEALKSAMNLEDI
jgi:hypothetical protein